MNNPRGPGMRFTRLETRFLLNFVIGENNKVVHKDGGHSQTNLNNYHDKNGRELPDAWERYERDLGRLLKKLKVADGKFYGICRRPRR